MNGSYSVLSEFQLIKLAQEGDDAAMVELLEKYQPLVYHFSQHYYLPDGDIQDLIQEGMIGLYKAICDFDETQSISFLSFAMMCIKRQIITAVKRSTRLYNQPLNQASSLDRCRYETNHESLIDTISSSKANSPEDLLLNKEYLSDIHERCILLLSRFEMDVLAKRINGYSYKEISERMKCPEKSIDNAMFRIRKKLKQLSL